MIAPPRHTIRRRVHAKRAQHPQIPASAQNSDALRFFLYFKLVPETGDTQAPKRILSLDSSYFCLVLSVPHSLFNLSESLRVRFLIFIRFLEKKLMMYFLTLGVRCQC